MAGDTVLNNRYELIAQQGSGGMSVIYRALDRLLGRTVAVKVLRPSLTQDPAFLEKFQQEARAIANLSHPNIITVYDVGNDMGTHYMVMELVDGQDLKKIIKDAAPLAVDRVIDLSIQIAAGLDYAHRSGLVHADVKPQNILVAKNDTVKVTDFGIAQALTDTQANQRFDVVWGSPHYFAPEQARGEPPSPASDVYAIGIVMFEMLTGKLPFSGASQQDLAMAHIKDPIPQVVESNPNVPEALNRIVYKLMSKEPSGRYRIAGQLEEVLRDLKTRARENTLRNQQVPPINPGYGMPAPQPPTAGVQPSQNRPPGVNLPPAAPPAEPTVRYSPAPIAPQPYNPRQQNIPVQPAQPLEQRYTVPPVVPPPPVTSGMRQPGDSAQYTPQYGVSQPIDPYAGDAPDYVTIALAILAAIAVAGLCPLLLLVSTAYN
jgi:serine/threonine-protein kinase